MTDTFKSIPFTKTSFTTLRVLTPSAIELSVNELLHDFASRLSAAPIHLEVIRWSTPHVSAFFQFFRCNFVQAATFWKLRYLLLVPEFVCCRDIQIFEIVTSK